jgi:TPR repeat protein
MNYKLNIADRDEDDVFRARLAPLASEVLPRQASRDPPRPEPVRPRNRRRLIAVAGVAGAAVALGAVSVYFEFPRQGWQDIAQAAARIDGAADHSPTATSLASAQSKEKFGIQDNARAALQDVPVSSQSLSSRSSPPSATEEMVGLLMRRGNTAIADGDIIAARMLYERAAALGSAAAATSVGKTYDIEFLLHAGARGIPPDQTSAVAWFRRAAALGDQEARAQLARIEGQGRP